MINSNNRATDICQRDGKVLLVRKARSKWNLPGGKIERHEMPKIAAQRELAEETGLSVEAFCLLGLHVLASKAHFVFKASLPEVMEAKPLGEISECQWFELSELESNPLKRSAKELIEHYCSLRQAAESRLQRLGKLDYL